ncbi:MAG: glycosyltransferase [Myxococcota bacterium]|jgi:dolichol-phosphate mannosyltransferase|nr:glycosyltransferase [Myxococcota bacterium]
MVIIALPAYNEAETLPFLLAAIRQSMQENKIEYRVVVVNDGSTDDTSSVVTALAGEMPIELIEHAGNLGLGEAIRTGLLSALEGAEPHDIIVTMDSDNTHTPGLIARMVRGIREGNDVVIASRYRQGANIRGVPRYRRLLSFGARVVFGLLFPTPNVRDFTCGFRAYRAEVLSRAFEQYGDAFVAQSGFSCMVDILLKLRRMNAIMSEVPLILRYDQKFGASKMIVIRTIGETLRLVISRRSGLG